MSLSVSIYHCNSYQATTAVPVTENTMDQTASISSAD